MERWSSDDGNLVGVDGNLLVQRSWIRNSNVDVECIRPLKVFDFSTDCRVYSRLIYLELSAEFSAEGTAEDLDRVEGLLACILVIFSILIPRSFN